MNEASEKRTNRRWLGVFGTAVACLTILAASAAAVVVINQTEPTAQQINATRKSAALVETVTVHRDTYSPQISVLGSVQPAREMLLSPRVSGQLIELSSKFVPGGMVKAGDLLLRIDPADFENALAIRQSRLEQAQADLEIEEGRQTLAEKELALLEGTIDETNRALVLREPQFASIKAQVAAAEAEVERARLDLQRTRVYAPFDAQILSRSVNVGSQVGPGDELGRLVGVQEYWVMVSVPVRSLRWVQFPNSDEQNSSQADQSKANHQLGSKVILRDEDAWGADVTRDARVTRMIGTLDQQSRLAQVLVTVQDPLGVNSNAPPLILDTLIEAQIQGRPIPNVVRLDRKHVHENDTVWVMVNNELEIREAEIIFRDADYAYITSGLNDGEEVVTTTLATVANGVGLRKIGDSSPQATIDADEGRSN